MTIYHQTFSPSTCECVIEEQFEYNETTKLVEGESSLWFFHKVCTRHEALVINKPKLSDSKLKQERDKIINHHKTLLQNNRVRHLNDFENNQKNKRDIIKELKKDKNTEPIALGLESEIAAEKSHNESFLDGHETKSMNTLLLGIFSPYAFNAQEVYDKIREEQHG